MGIHIFMVMGYKNEQGDIIRAKSGVFFTPRKLDLIEMAFSGWRHQLHIPTIQPFFQSSTRLDKRSGRSGIHSLKSLTVSLSTTFALLFLTLFQLHQALRRMRAFLLPPPLSHQTKVCLGHSTPILMACPSSPLFEIVPSQTSNKLSGPFSPSPIVSPLFTSQNSSDLSSHAQVMLQTTKRLPFPGDLSRKTQTSFLIQNTCLWVLGWRRYQK
jgi:hypothetical protein